MLNHKKLNQFLDLALERLRGDWVLLGGSLLHLLNIQERVTYDIDMVEMQGRTQDLALMQIAEDLNLPIEAINQAAIFFLEKIPNYQNKLIVIRETKEFKLYRPNASLYLELKMNRGNPSDIEDCKTYLNFCRQEDNINEAEIRKLKEKYPKLY